MLAFIIRRLLQALLGLPTPRYHHHALLTDDRGERLAKRHGAPSLADLRADGADPAALRAHLREDTGQSTLRFCKQSDHDGTISGS